MTDTTDKSQTIPEDLTNQHAQGGQPEPKKDETPAPAPAQEATPKDTPKPDEASKVAEPPKPDDKKDDDEDDTPLDVDTWGSTGDEVGDSVLQLLQNSKMSTDEATELFAEAAKTLDASKIDKQKVIDKLGKTKAALVLAGVDNFIAKTKAQNEIVLNTLHTEAGGKEAWETIAAWAKDNVSNDERLEYAELINAGGKKAAFAVHDLKARHAEAGNTDPADTTVVPQQSGATPATEPLSSRAYFEKLEALERTGKATEAGRLALWKARELGKKKGI